MLLPLCRAAALVAMLLLASPPPSPAFHPIQFGYTAQVLSITDMGDLPALMVSDVISGHYVFDGDTPGASQSPGSGLFPNAMIRGAVDFLGQNFGVVRSPGLSVTDSQIEVQDYDIEPTTELYRAGLENIPEGGASDLTDFVVLLQNPGPSSGIMGTDLPLTPPDPMAFANATVQIRTTAGSMVIADLVTLPEPGAAGAALALGFALARLGRGRVRNGS